MTWSGPVGRVQTLWRFPVKSMLGEQLAAVVVGRGGILGDRAYAVRDRATGKVASAKYPRRWPGLLACRAAFVEPPCIDDELPPVRIELADGDSVLSDAPDVDAVLSRFFGRDVELARTAQNGYTIDQYHPAEENYDPEGHRDEVVEARFGAAFFNDRGLPSAVSEGSFFDLFPLSVITSSTLERLHELAPQSRFEARRFRMNVVVETPARGFVENDWPGHTLTIGDDVRIGVAIPDPRCVMPSLAQGDLPPDPKVLKALMHNRIEVAGSLYPCAGVYAVTEATGTVRGDDLVCLL
ncbi:MOSC domain-containing protein [Mycobacterium lacus]|nr:MOSC N-terminal beta barrel domain-containing protein [Mycobacterium lacus]MCV7122617.1 MOSC domain-containing protein [Mycobacterium lacus]